MKIKVLLLLTALFSFAFSCSPEEQPQSEDLGCECRKMYYEQQTVSYAVQFVYTHRGEWEQIDCSIKESGTLQPNGYIWTSFYVIDATHNYRWECKNQ